MPEGPPERWYTFKEAALALEEQYGFHTSPRYLEKLADAGRPGGLPSQINFGRRQVQLSQVLPWLRANGLIER